MLCGLLLGFFLGILCLFWVNESVFTRRHQMGKVDLYSPLFYCVTYFKNRHHGWHVYQLLWSCSCLLLKNTQQNTPSLFNMKLDLIHDIIVISPIFF